jgi:hypothetical protein
MKVPVGGPIVEWLRSAAFRRQLRAQVHVHSVGQATGTRTQVRIDHRIPGGPDDAREGWRIFTGANVTLPGVDFPAKARSKISEASAERGRRIYVEDLESSEVAAAAAYHLDEDGKMPLLMTALALRGHTGTVRAARSRTAAHILTEHLHEISRQTGGEGYVDADVGDKAMLQELTDLGFYRAKRVKGFRPSATHMRKDPLF